MFHMKQSNILLINPPVYDFAAYDLWARPLGLLYLSAILREAGCHITLVDAMDRGNPTMPPTRKGAHGCGHYHAMPVKKPRTFSHIPRIYRRFGIPTDALQAAIAAAPATRGAAPSPRSST